MSENELLLAISSMMDTKLEANLKPIKNDIAEMKGDIEGLKGEVREIKEDIVEMKGDIEGLKGEVRGIKEDIAEMKGDIEGLKGEVRKINLTLENNVMPRLQNIEACYIDTYDRYRNGADRMEEAFEDIKLIKRVVMDHSEKLKNVG